MMISLNPATGAELSRYEVHDASAVEEALAAASTAQRAWRRTPVRERVQLLQRMAEVLRRDLPALAELVALEVGKPIVEAEAEIEKCALNCDFYARNAEDFLADEIVASSASESMLAYEPLGVVLAIMPWNYPFWQFFRFAAPALAAGNGTILKHANNVPQCALAIQGVLDAAGCPAGLVRALLIEPEAVAGLIADDRIAAVTLTGSTQVGGIVAAQAGAALKKQVLELGGSDPFIVLADADVEQAAAVAVKARFVNVGQSCVNAKRFIVVEEVAERFVAAFTAGVEALVVGEPMDRATQIGPMARANLRDGLHRQVRATIEQGATLVTGGSAIDRPGFYYAPTILDHVSPTMVAACEETFGPVAAIIRVADEDEAIRVANSTEFGLGAAIWSRDPAKARLLASAIDAGAVFINGMVASDPRLPFGGIKKSGYGRELGVLGMREFTNIKTVWIGPARIATPVEKAEGGRQLPFGPAVLRPAGMTPRARGGGARTIPLVMSHVGSTSILNGITEFEPGAAIPLHFHNCEESVVVLEGTAVAVIDGVEHALGVNDTTWLPAGVPHFFRNASATERMRILWIYASVDATRTLVSTGETRRVDEEHGAR